MGAISGDHESLIQALGLGPLCIQLGGTISGDGSTVAPGIRRPRGRHPPGARATGAVPNEVERVRRGEVGQFALAVILGRVRRPRQTRAIRAESRSRSGPPDGSTIANQRPQTPRRASGIIVV